MLADGHPVGWLGEIHPQVAADWEIRETVAAFEVDLDAVAERATGTPLYDDVTSFPEVREDLAVIVDVKVSAAQVLAVVRRAGAPLLARAEVFDVYRDPDRIGEGNVSLALRLSYRARRPHPHRSGGSAAAREDRHGAGPGARREGPCRLASPYSARPASPVRSPLGCCIAIRSSSCGP